MSSREFSDAPSRQYTTIPEADENASFWANRKKYLEKVLEKRRYISLVKYMFTAVSDVPVEWLQQHPEIAIAAVKKDPRALEIILQIQGLNLSKNRKKRLLEVAEESVYEELDLDYCLNHPEKFPLTHELAQQDARELKAALRFKVSQLENSFLTSVLELVHKAKEHPGLFEEIAMAEGAERAKMAGDNTSLYAEHSPNDESMRIRRVDLIDKAYELIFPGEFPELMDYDYKRQALDSNMGFHLNGNHTGYDDESDYDDNMEFADSEYES